MISLKPSILARLIIVMILQCAQNHPEYGKEEEKNKIAKFEEPLLLFPIEQVEYLSHVNQVLSSLVQCHIVV